MPNHFLPDTALPYVTYDSPVSTEPTWQDGANAITSQRGYVEARPGFSVELVPGPFTGTIRKMFSWRKWGGSYFWMVSTTDSTSSYVYKFEMGVDVAAVLIHTDSSSTVPFDYVVSNNTCYFGNAHDFNRKYEGVSTTVYLKGIVAPTVAPTYTTAAGALTTIAGGSYYFYTFVREISGSLYHESSSSDASICTGNAASLKYTNTLTYSNDPQVTHLYLYRGTDGGGNDPSKARYVSKVANVVGTGTTTVADEALDTALGAKTAPGFLLQEPMPPCKGFVTHAGRIAGFKDNKVYYTGFEEISLDNGVPEESWPGGADGNYRPYAQEVFALAEVADGIAVALATDVHKIEGDSLDTFRFYKLLSHQGAQSTDCFKSFGGMAVLFDSSSSVWLMGGDELSLPIRPTLAALSASTSQLALHFQGSYRWVCVLDTANNVIYAMDSDTHKWFVPWTFAHSVTAIASGQDASGVFQLAIAYNGKIMKAVAGALVDDADAFAGRLRSNLFNLVPEQEPFGTGAVHHISAERNSTAIASCSLLVDDDTAYTAGYSALTQAPLTDPNLRTQGIQLLEDQFMCYGAEAARAGRRVSFELNWGAGGWKLYSIGVNYQPQGKQRG